MNTNYLDRFKVNEGSKHSEGKRGIWITAVIFWGVAAMTLVPIFIASGYTVYWSDDICTAKANGTHTIIEALKNVIHWWLTWQGTYTGAFLEVALSPLNGFGFAQLHVVMVLNIMLFSASLWTFINAICRSMGVSKRKYSILFFSLCVIGIFGFTGWTEVFFWFVGAMVYSFPMSFCLLGLAAALQSKSFKGMCISGLFMFLASGGSLEIAGISCFTMLGICIIKWMTKSLRKIDFVIFGTAVFGALVNTVAPGNYIRHAVIDDTGLHIGKAIIYTVLEVLQTVEGLLFDTSCILLIFVAFVFGATTESTKEYRGGGGLCMIILLCIVSPLVTCFPVFLGYSETVFPNRCLFIETIVIICSFMIIAAVGGYIIKEKGILVCKGEIYVGAVAFLIAISSVNSTWRISQSVPFQMWKEIARDSYKNIM